MRMDENEVRDELFQVMSELIMHLESGWLWKMARADRISELRHRRLELLAILINFKTARERSSTSTPSEADPPHGGVGSGRG